MNQVEREKLLNNSSVVIINPPGSRAGCELPKALGEGGRGESLVVVEG